MGLIEREAEHDDFEHFVKNYMPACWPSASSDGTVRIGEAYHNRNLNCMWQVWKQAKFEMKRKVEKQLGELEQERDKLRALINSPQIHDFLEAVKLEAAHQQERHGTEHDAGKSDEDWLFLVGFLGGKAVQCGKLVQYEPIDTMPIISQPSDKRLHHIITMAAVCLNWHQRLIGADTRMRPGIGEG